MFRTFIQLAAAAVILSASGCATEPPGTYRMLATAKDPALFADGARFAQQVNSRTGLDVSLGTAISERSRALTLRCTHADGGCERAVDKLRATGWFEVLEPERRAKKQ